jgi:hypothetical protein
MRGQRKSSRQTTYEFLGVWETTWQESAARARKAERASPWLRSQGISRGAKRLSEPKIYSSRRTSRELPGDRSLPTPQGACLPEERQAWRRDRSSFLLFFWRHDAVSAARKGMTPFYEHQSLCGEFDL